MTEYQAPTSDEIQRVAAYWARVKAMACEHPSLTFQSMDPPKCSECDRPVRFLSDIQIEDMRKATDRTGLNAEFARQLDRGGVHFVVDGERYEYRLVVHHEDGFDDEYVCIDSTVVQKMLRATDTF